MGSPQGSSTQKMLEMNVGASKSRETTEGRAKDSSKGGVPGSPSEPAGPLTCHLGPQPER
jgi:hypothetical protein